MNRIHAVLLLLFVCALAFAGCTSSSFPASGRAVGQMAGVATGGEPSPAQYDSYVFIERREPEAGAQSYLGDDGRAGAGPVRAKRLGLPGSGALRCELDGVEIELPLERTDVVISVLGPMASGAVRQRFTNPFERTIEAEYVFPLPHDAAVHDFVLTLGDRRIRGVVRERAEATRMYEEAKRRGRNASLLTQHRPNIFQQQVANLTPGQTIDVELAYLEPVDYADGWHELAFPMVVGPRYNPVGWERGIGAAPVGRSGGRAMPLTIEYLDPEARSELRSGADLTLRVELEAGLGVERIESPSHPVRIEERHTGAVVELEPSASIANADFRLRWRVARGEGVDSSLVRQGDYGLLTLYPPASLDHYPRVPLEHVFVLDTSGSMKGKSLETLKRAMRAGIDQLGRNDTFNLLSFSGGKRWFARQPVLATDRNLRDAERWLGRLKADGGTEMVPALDAALSSPADGERQRIVTFMTDAQISNEDQVLRMVAERRAEARIFSFGIGSSPNRWLLAEMAQRSGGAAAFLSYGEDPRAATADFFERVTRPAVTDLAVNVEGVQSATLGDLPLNLIHGRPVSVPLRFQGAGPSVEVSVSGRVGGRFEQVARSRARDCASAPAGSLGKVWARSALSDLAARLRGADRRTWEQLQGQMLALALEYGLVSDQTAFIAVDTRGPNVVPSHLGGTPPVVPVPVHVPAGQSYETTVGGGSARGGR